MRLPYDLVVFDLESEGANIIEIGAVRFLRNGTVEDSFQSFVNVNIPLSEHIKKLTNIKDSDLEKAPSFKQAMEEFYKWSIQKSKNVILCSWGSGDVRELRAECSIRGIEFPFRNKALDAGSIFIWMSTMLGGEKGSDSLTSAIQRRDMKFLGIPHSALADATNTALLLQDLWKQYDSNLIGILTSLKNLGVK